MNSHRILMQVGISLAMAYALGSAEAAPGAKSGENSAAASSSAAQAPGASVATAPAGPRGKPDTSGLSAETGKPDSAPRKPTMAEAAQRKKFDTAEESIEKSAERLDDAHLKAARERDKRRRDRDRAKRTPVRVQATQNESSPSNSGQGKK